MVGYRAEGDGALHDEREHPTGTFGLLEAQAKAAGVALLAVNEDGVVLSHNELFLDMWALLPEALASGSLSAVIEALGRGDETAAMAASVLGAGEAAERGEITSPDGRVIEWGVAETSDACAKVWTFREVSRERNALRALRDAENWLRMFAAHADGVVLELDTNARIIGLWAAKATFFDKPESALQGHTLRDALAEPHGSQFDARVRAVLATGRPESFEYVVGAGGERRVFAANTVLLPSHEGYPTTVTVLIRDVTERARLQHQVLQSERLASLGVLAAGVAHEINNPLGYMLLNLERVRRALGSLAAAGGASERHDIATAPAALVQSLDMAIEGTLHVQQIVQDLRRFSRSSHDEPHVEVDLRRVLTFTLDMTGPVIHQRARVTRDFGDVPAVLASEGRLNQVFLNLVLNAVQAIPEGAPDHHEVRVRTYTDAGGNAVVEIRDTGEGILEAHLGKIFDPFFTTKPPGVGTGLGLAICHNIMTSFGGEITADSTVGVGSVFRVVLPAARERGSAAR